MNSAIKYGTSIKRIVLTSSFASIVNPHDFPWTYKEDQWNTESPRVYSEKGKDAPGGDIYRTSKVRAEKAAWDLLEKHKPGFDLVTMCPPLVVRCSTSSCCASFEHCGLAQIGPLIHQVPQADSLNTSVAMHRAYLTNQKKVEELQGL